jgi:hypothetical protein
MLEAELLPEFSADLVAALAYLEGDYFAWHGGWFWTLVAVVYRLIGAVQYCVEEIFYELMSAPTFTSRQNPPRPKLNTHLT